MNAPASPQVAAVRRFNRFYTQSIGVLQERLLSSPHSLAEARVLFEVARSGRTQARELVATLGLDPGYLSRILRRLADAGLIAREPAADDRRRTNLSLTERGRERFAWLDATANDEVGTLLEPLAAPERDRLVAAMDVIEGLIDGAPSAEREPATIRRHRAGDLGWLLQRHAELYAEEYGWGRDFEALVAEIVTGMLRDFDPARERCWIAESGGERIGCVALLGNSDDPAHTAQLRLLLVEPAARGTGLGGRLVRRCTSFAREAGYRRIRLMTNAELDGARRLYEREGYRLVHQGPNRDFDGAPVEQIWELEL